MKKQFLFIVFLLIQCMLVTGQAIDARVEYQLQFPNSDDFSLLWHGFNGSVQVFISDFIYFHMGAEIFDTGQGEENFESASSYTVREKFLATILEPGIGIGANITDWLSTRIYVALALASYQQNGIIFGSVDSNGVPLNTEPLNETVQSFGWLIGSAFNIRLFEIPKLNAELLFTFGIANLYLSIPSYENVFIADDFGGRRISAGLLFQIRKKAAGLLL
jgi:hypothetical protein